MRTDLTVASAPTHPHKPAPAEGTRRLVLACVATLLLFASAYLLWGYFAPGGGGSGSGIRPDTSVGPADPAPAAAAKPAPAPRPAANAGSDAPATDPAAPAFPNRRIAK